MASTVLKRTGLCTKIVFDAHGVRLRFWPSAMSQSLWADPDGWAETVRWFERYCRVGDTIVDVGANIGLLALVAARSAGPTGQVVAIEPDPRVFTFLSANVRLNRAANVSCLNIAAGSEEGFLSFTDDNNDDQNRVAADETGIQVVARRLDSIVDAVQGHIHLLKIDVEGFEYEVLRGASEVLDRTDCVYYEACDEHLARYGHEGTEVEDLLTTRGFAIYQQVGPETVVPVRPGDRPVGCTNRVAVRAEAVLCERGGLRIG